MRQENVKQDLATETIKNIILDTDAFNEVDDQFALAYAMRSTERVKLISVNAAPFLNERSVSARDGMEKSFAEIKKIMNLVAPGSDIPVYRGSENFLDAPDRALPSEAAENIINTAMRSEDTVYVVAIGAATNIASALLKCPEIASKIAVIWLGGHALHYPNTAEFNLRGDIAAARVLFDSRVPLVQVPCGGVCTELITTIPELEYYLAGKNELCDYLLDIVRKYPKSPFAWSKVIWDVAAVACVVKPNAANSVLLPRPVISSECRYSFDMSRHPYLYVRKLNRDMIYADLFSKLVRTP